MNLLISLLLIALIFWLAKKSPLFAWTGKLLLLLLWGVGTLGAALYVLIEIYVPRRDYNGALLTALIAAIMFALWVARGTPEIRKMFQADNRRFKLWE